MQTAQEFHTKDGFFHLKKIHICKARGYSKFRVWVYDIDTITGAPSSKLIENGIEVKSAKRNIIIDITNYKVNLPNSNFFIAIEWLFEEENKYFEKQKGLNRIIQKVAKYEPSISISYNAYGIKSWNLYYNNNRWYKSGNQILLISAEITQ